MAQDTIRVNESLSIPATELSFRATRSGGPGGQHVNTSSTRVELLWNVDASAALSDDQRERIRSKLAGRISGEGILSVSDSSTRSQHRNRAEATARFAEILRLALQRKKPRRRTKPSRASREKRLEAKKQRSRTKQLRRKPVRE